MGVCVYRTQHACMLVCLLLRAACVRCDVNYLRFVTTPKKQIGKANRAGYELLAKCHVRKATTFMKEKRCVPLSLCLCLSLSLSLSLPLSVCRCDVCTRLSARVAVGVFGCDGRCAPVQPAFRS